MIQNWSFTIDREIVRNWAVSVAYIGKTGRNLLAFRPFNAAPFIPGTDANGNPLSTRANIDERAPFLPGTYGTGGAYLDNPFRNNYKYGGSFHCATVDIRRRGTLQSYF